MVHPSAEALESRQIRFKLQYRTYYSLRN